MKKIVAIALSLMLVLSSVSALAFEQAASYTPDARVYDGGEITTAAAQIGGGSVTSDVYAGIEGMDYTDEKVYTFNDYTSGIGSSMNWDPLSWETNDDSNVLDFISSGFYTFKLNSTKTGYSIVPELAAEMPVDVTAEYVGQYGVNEGDANKAWRIALNPDACWSNGEKITADDHVYSIQQLLNPKILNRRADSYYAGDFVIVNAKNYLYAGGATYDLYTGVESPDTLYVDMWGFWGMEGAVDAEGNACPQYASITDDTMYRDLAVEDETADEAFVSGAYLWNNYLTAGAPYAAYATSYVYSLNAPTTMELYTGEQDPSELYVDMWGFWGMEGAVDAEGNACPQYASVSDDTMYRDLAVEDETADEAFVSGAYLWNNYLAAGAPYAAYATSYVYYKAAATAVTWEDVGFKKIDDYTIDFILANPVEEPAFYVPYNLSSSYLVYKPLYEECKRFFDASGAEVDNEEDATTITTIYCRTLDTTISYGPYCLASFELDKEYSMSRNENWWGYHDGKHLGQYQMDNYKVTLIAEHATQMMAFEKGEIDGVSLQSEDMDKYATSQYIKYTPQSYTTKLSFNLDYEKLLSRGTNSQILVIDEFRNAFGICYDRKEFATAFTAAGTAGFGLLNEQYCYNPFTGEAYRANDYAKAGLLKVFGLEYGEGKDYATLDEAYDAMTGYDLEQARALMAVAYDKAIAAGVYDGESPIEIEFRVYNSDEIYVKMYTYLNEHLQAACAGTGFEGKVSLKMTVDADYYETHYSGGADMIFTTWGGAAMSPFGVLYQCYCDDSTGQGQQMEYGYKTEDITLKMVVDGTEVVASLQDWALWADGSTKVDVIEDLIGKFISYDYNTRCAFFAQMEACFLNWYPTTSVYYRNVASLISQKYNYACDTYLNIIGFGGYDFWTFNYDDASWAEYTANNTLVY